MGLKEAAETLAHYIKLSLEKQGVALSPEGQDELRQAVKAFEDADKSLYQLHSLHP